MKNIDAKAVGNAIHSQLSDELEKGLVELDFGAAESRVLASMDSGSLEELQRKLENATGIRRDLMERGRDTLASRIRTIQKRLTLSLEPVMGKMRDEEAVRCCAMIKELAKQLALPDVQVPAIQMSGAKLNTSRCRAKNQKLGHHAERMASRWPAWHRRNKKWMRVAARCGVAVLATLTFQPVRPAEYLKLDFDITPAGAVFK